MVYNAFLETVKKQMEQNLGTDTFLPCGKYRKITVWCWTVSVLQKARAPLLLLFISIPVMSNMKKVFLWSRSFRIC